MPAVQHEDGMWSWGKKGRPIYKTQREAEKAGIAALVDRINKTKEKLDKACKEHK